MVGVAMGELLAPRHGRSHIAMPTAFDDDEGGGMKNPNSSGGVCSPDGEMLWQKSVDGKQNRYYLCYAPATRNGGQGPTGGSLACEPYSYVSVEGPRFCCRNPRITMNGEKM